MKKFLKYFALVLVIVYLVLLIPDKKGADAVEIRSAPFAWNRDSLWNRLENDFKSSRIGNRAASDSTIMTLLRQQNNDLDYITSHPQLLPQEYPALLLPGFFSLSAELAANPAKRDSLMEIYNKARILVKRRSENWDMNAPSVRNSVYQVLYGMRAGMEEVLLQSDSMAYSPVLLVENELSATPSADIAGIKVHSGDLLVSRGGAEVSAMISRGNDYPGNFSHVALVYVDAVSGKASLIEAHIEKGVAVATVDEYLADKKLRFMVLRPRADLPKLIADPMLPHKAAKDALDAALSHHTPYDFKMNFRDSTALFCSEVGSLAYKHQGIQLWQGVSTISSKGVINWLQEFGVKNFVTQMPSDLEYDPQLSVVAEWRDPQTLRKDHIDNAVMDVLLEKADSGKKIRYDHWKLPFVRVLKGWCMLQNRFGKAGMIPEGMSATQALKNQYFVKMYQTLRMNSEANVDGFIKEFNYFPPYWQIVSIARKTSRE
jgi:hypothetical protein